VFSGRAEESKLQSSIVTMRAVEKFESAIKVAEALTSPGGRLALLIGGGQAHTASHALPKLTWQQPVVIPESRERVFLVGTKERE
jgi:16S rRNA G527 N7-methylase RsmG